MKVLAINGSPNANGNTYHTLKIIGKEILNKNIEFEIIHIGNLEIKGCTGCHKCIQTKNNRCVFTNDFVNTAISIIESADGIILGAPVHFSGIPGTMKSFLDRIWYVSSCNGNSLFHNKVGAAVVSLRRSGGSATLDSLYHYLTYSEMILATSNYWNVIHGTTPGEIKHDLEGIQIVRTLGKNIAWILKMKENSKINKLCVPEKEEKIMTNFIR